MNGPIIELLVLAGIAVFFIMRLKNVLGTREGYEAPRVQDPEQSTAPDFEVIEGGLDQDIADHVDINSPAGTALQEMKAVEPEFSLTEFLGGARQAYEMILMAFENGDLETLKPFLSNDVYESFESVIEDRKSQGLVIEATFIGVREVKVVDATFDRASNEGEITMKFIGELTSVVKNEDGEIIEGDETTVKKQKDIWTFARVMGSNDPNWQLVATGE